MTILITADGEFVTEKGDSPEVGKRYWAELDENYTGNQRRTFEALIDCFYKSGCYNYDTVSKDDLRARIKKEYGEGFEFTYTKGNGELGHCKESENVPAECVESGRWLYSLKSTTRYTKKQMTRLIDGLIVLMTTCNVQTAKFYEILKGMEAA